MQKSNFSIGQGKSNYIVRLYKKDIHCNENAENKSVCLSNRKIINLTGKNNSKKTNRQSQNKSYCTTQRTYHRTGNNKIRVSLKQKNEKVQIPISKNPNKKNQTSDKRQNQQQQSIIESEQPISDLRSSNLVPINSQRYKKSPVKIQINKPLISNNDKSSKTIIKIRGSFNLASKQHQNTPHRRYSQIQDIIFR